MVHGQALAHTRDKGPRASYKVIVNIVVHAAKAEVAVREARPGNGFQQVQNLLAVVKGVQKG